MLCKCSPSGLMTNSNHFLKSFSLSSFKRQYFCARSTHMCASRCHQMDCLERCEVVPHSIVFWDPTSIAQSLKDLLPWALPSMHCHRTESQSTGNHTLQTLAMKSLKFMASNLSELFPYQAWMCMSSRFHATKETCLSASISSMWKYCLHPSSHKHNTSELSSPVVIVGALLGICSVGLHSGSGTRWFRQWQWVRWGGGWLWQHVWSAHQEEGKSLIWT